MANNESNTTKERENAKEKLLSMMNHPGRFPILVLGDTGTGKSHWIEKLSEDEVEYKNKITFKNCGLLEDTQKYWEDLLEKNHNHFLVLEDVEKLPSKSQDILFNALSTKNGKYGCEEKKYELRIIFTSTFPIKKIRDDRRYLSAKFFDRISQFVVVFPNFDLTQRSIYDDFKATWDKILSDTKFKEKCPETPDFKAWLNTIAYKMHGNFRDLDKIVINWNLHQINEISDEEILKLLKNDFDILLHNPSQKIYDDNTFVFDEDSNYGDMLNDFRKKIKNWALAINENKKIEAAKQLGISHRTMDRW